MGRTGAGQFRVGIPPLSLGWQTNPASGWGPDAAAGNASWPGGQLLSAQLAKWVWSVDATDPAAWPVNAYLLPIDVCGERDWPPVELCNGVDDDGDGLADEGFPDGDADGIANCADEEGPLGALDAVVDVDQTRPACIKHHPRHYRRTRRRYSADQSDGRRTRNP